MSMRFTGAAFLLQSAVVFGQALSGTRPLVETGDLSLRMVAGIERYLERATQAAVGEPLRQPDRAEFLKRIGAVDPRVPYDRPWIEQEPLAESSGYAVRAVRWPVFARVDAEGLLLTPKGRVVARVVALPEADWTPERVAGLESGAPERDQYARRLAESGIEVLVPVMIDRADTWSGNARLNKFTNYPHREFLHRMAYEAGRHPAGFEVQKVLAAVDWLVAREPKRPVGVAGYGEGGLVAFYGAAADERISAALVSGYFGPRQQNWEEPIYRTFWGLLRGYRDAEVASLVAPRALVIESRPGPVIAGPPAVRDGRRGAAPGSLRAFSEAEVAGEFMRIGARGNAVLLPDGLSAFVEKLGGKLGPPGPPPRSLRPGMDVSVRLRRQFDQLVEHTQGLIRESEFRRQEFWPAATQEAHKRYLWEEVIGRLPEPAELREAYTRVQYDNPIFTGYEVVLPVWQDVFAYGVLLIPKDLKPDERRPVVVCQHGLEGRPQDVIEAREPRAEAAYKNFAARLAGRGYIVFAPQNPYIHGDRFRRLLRRSHPLKLTLFSFITGQHQRITDWLAGLPFVDPERIAFYGLSYGGKTAMRVPPLVDRYMMSICSGDFNEWIWKTTSVSHPFSYMFTIEYDMLEWNLANTYNYAEMARLIWPRPFMVERGHSDGVGIDEWVAYEYAKVRRFYAENKMPERTRIEFFSGGHTINGAGTFAFLDYWLKPPGKTGQ